MVSKALVHGPYQRKAELLAAEPDIQLTVVVPPLWRDGRWEQRLERRHTRGYQLVETPIFRPGDFHLHFYPRLGALLDAVRPDLVHIDEEAYNLATFLALMSARRRGARTVFFTWQNLKRRYPPPFGLMERYVYHHVDGAITGSQTAAAVLAAKGYAGPVVVIPQFGVDPQEFCPRPSAPAGRLAVGYIGRLVPAKGVDLLIEALAGLAGYPWQLTVVGDGPARPALERLARSRGIADRVCFRSWVPGHQLPDLYRTLDVLVLPSRSTASWMEQFGRVLIEAMASGVACVGADSGEIPHVLGEAGLIFPEGDVAALGRHLARLAADHQLRARLSRTGRERVLARFTMSRVAAETANFYRRIMTRHRRCP